MGLKSIDGVKFVAPAADKVAKAEELRKLLEEQVALEAELAQLKERLVVNRVLVAAALKDLQA